MPGHKQQRFPRIECPQAVYIPPPCEYPQPILPLITSVSAENTFETTPLPGMSVRAGEARNDPNYHPNTLVVTLPIGVEPSFLYHGRTKSFFSAGNGVAEVSRNNRGLRFDPDDVGVADGCTEIRRTLVHTPSGSSYEYRVSFKKEIPGDTHQTGAMDPGKMAIRVNGKEYSLAPAGAHEDKPVAPDPRPLPLPLPSPKDPMMLPPPTPGGFPIIPKSADEVFPTLPKGGPAPGKGTKPSGSDDFIPEPPKGGPAPLMPPAKKDPAFPPIPPGGPMP